MPSRDCVAQLVRATYTLLSALEAYSNTRMEWLITRRSQVRILPQSQVWHTPIQRAKTPGGGLRLNPGTPNRSGKVTNAEIRSEAKGCREACITLAAGFLFPHLPRQHFVAGLSWKLRHAGALSRIFLYICTESKKKTRYESLNHLSF